MKWESKKHQRLESTSQNKGKRRAKKTRRCGTIEDGRGRLIRQQYQSLFVLGTMVVSGDDATQPCFPSNPSFIALIYTRETEIAKEAEKLSVLLADPGYAPIMDRWWLRDYTLGRVGSGVTEVAYLC